jgi:hypothetical protein
MQPTEREIKMQRDEFVEMVCNTTFDDEIKKLFITSYEVGYREGQINQLTKDIQVFQLDEPKAVQ